MTRRREFVGGLVGAALTQSFPAVAQQRAKPVIGFLNSQSSDSFAHLAAAFIRGLRQTGFIDGENRD